MKRLSLILVLALLAAMLVPMSASALEFKYAASTNLKGAESPRIYNIRHALEILDEYTVDYGETFSFNDVIGPRTAETGYYFAENGRGVRVKGGGIAQLANTLYLALVKVDGIDFEPLFFYGSEFVGDYVDDGAIALVTDYNAGRDLAFENLAGDLYFDFTLTSEALTCTVTLSNIPHIVPEGTLVGSACVTFDDSDKALLNNVELAAMKLNKTVLRRTDTFSLNELVGARTKENGFKVAVNGRGVDVMGGGVGIVASALDLALQDFGMVKYLERRTYGSNFTESYDVTADDAILVDYSQNYDFRFYHTKWGGKLYIDMWVEDGALYCDLYLLD